VPNTLGSAQKAVAELETPLYAATNALTDARYFENSESLWSR